MYGLHELNIILASASPRRKSLLEQIGLHPVIMPRPCAELKQLEAGIYAASLVRENSRRKADATHAFYGYSTEALIVAADTVVVLDGQLFGKPADAEQARAMLRQLSGGAHSVYTGLTLLDGLSGISVSGAETARVWFSELDDAVIDEYVAGGEPLDKAGAYGIQGMGGLLVERIDGDYTTVVGLSLPLLRRLWLELQTLI
ncbi:MAG: Maf family protein [Bacillota bacterium]|nr:Maf family protein [Bacillota bacterium]